VTNFITMVYLIAAPIQFVITSRIPHETSKNQKIEEAIDALRNVLQGEIRGEVSGWAVTQNNLSGLKNPFQLLRHIFRQPSA
jgi:hypothetical protein